MLSSGSFLPLFLGITGCRGLVPASVSDLPLIFPILVVEGLKGSLPRTFYFSLRNHPSQVSLGYTESTRGMNIR